VCFESYVKLLAHVSICRPQLKYAAVVWYSSLQYFIRDIELVQKNAIRFIAKLKVTDSITKARISILILSEYLS